MREWGNWRRRDGFCAPYDRKKNQLISNRKRALWANGVVGGKRPNGLCGKKERWREGWGRKRKKERKRRKQQEIRADGIFKGSVDYSHTRTNRLDQKRHTTTHRYARRSPSSEKTAELRNDRLTTHEKKKKGLSRRVTKLRIWFT